ncbi:hypothetical protein [Paraburkholderia youngii]|uniref:Uncharacterized protein n=1 Tax=Paraburkholderia youngii TaxID=2782701 RepID=A0ABX2NQ83_9BURK|nr:hypothetical protein [Paraburkholderia youngii]NVI06370.1 hypothetical protein [Paraburkholderia youngii]
MQVFVNLPLKSLRRVRGHAQSTYHSGWFNVVRLFGPEHTEYYRGLGRNYIWADIEIADDLKPSLSNAGYNADGSLRVQVWVNTHRKTLAAFLASGDQEWDMREREQ